MAGAPWNDGGPCRSGERKLLGRSTDFHVATAMQAAQQSELEAMTDMFNKCAAALASRAPPAARSPSPNRPPGVSAG